MCERAILLFNEYIDLAKSTFTDSSNFKINSTDVKLFIYKRTIGPIKLKKLTNKKFQNTIKKIKKSSIKIKYIFNKISVIIVNILENSKHINLKNELNKYLEYIENLLPNILQKLYINDIEYNIDKFILNIEHSFDMTNIIKFINILKLNLEIIYYIYKKTGLSQKNIVKIITKLDLNQNITNTENKLNIFLDKNIEFDKIEYYIKAIKKNK